MHDHRLAPPPMSSPTALAPRPALARLALLPALLLGACARSAPPAPVAPVAQVPAASASGIVAATDTAIAAPERARLLLARAVDALGGDDTVSRLTGFALELDAYAGRGNWTQARRWTDTMPNPIPTRLRQAVDLARGRAVSEFLSTSPGPIQFNYRSAYDSAGSWTVDLMRWRLGDDVQRGAAPAARAAVAALARQLPQGAVRQALAAGNGARIAGDTLRDGRRLTLLVYPDASNAQPVTLAIDVETGRPAFVAVAGAETSYDDYQTVDGARVPFRRVQRVAGAVGGMQQVTRVTLRPPLDDARFAPPAGYAEPPAPGAPRATRIADGIYRLDDMPGGYHAAFVVAEDGVAVLEAPQTPAYTAVALRLIGEVAPGKAVTRVFVTHHHADHVGGLAPYVARGAAVVVDRELGDAVRRQLPDSLRARVRFELVDSARTFGAGAARVVAYPVPNAHADGNVAYFLPAHGVLFQGDLFYLPERGAVPPAFLVTEDLARAVRERGLRVRQIVGVHGRSGTWDDVDASRRLRGAR